MADGAGCHRRVGGCPVRRVATRLALVFPPEVTVPDVVGLTYDEAKPVMEAAGLVLEIEAEQFHPEIPAGRIVRQTPPAERIVRQGRHILIALSRGPEIGLVPDIVGMPLREARIAVTQAGYTLGQEFDDFSDEAVANFVTSQQPPPGAEVAKGTPINLWVGRRAAAAAEETVTIPDFRGRDIDQVVQELERLGLMPGNRWPELQSFRAGRNRPGPESGTRRGGAAGHGGGLRLQPRLAGSGA